MRAKDNLRTAAEVLVDQLIVNGVEHAFCVPGESYLAVLDAFHDRAIKVTVCRQEGGAAIMDCATGRRRSTARSIGWPGATRRRSNPGSMDRRWRST